MEITMGKQALFMQRKRKWVKKTKIGCEQELVELWRGGKISIPWSQDVWSHCLRANFATTSKPQHHNFSYYLVCTNCDFKSLPEVRTNIHLFINHCRNGRYYLHHSASVFSFYQQALTLSPKYILKLTILLHLHCCHVYQVAIFSSLGHYIHSRVGFTVMLG